MNERIHDDPRKRSDSEDASSYYEHPPEIEVVDSELYSVSAPEISVTLEDWNGGIETDPYTGLPKLPIELPEDPLEERLRQPDFSPSSSRKMSSKSEKTVSFQSQLGMGQELKKSSHHRMPNKLSQPIHKTLSDTSCVDLSSEVNIRSSPHNSRRKNGRPNSLPSRSRSVIIRLQMPSRGTPTSVRKEILADDDSKHSDDGQFTPSDFDDVSERMECTRILDDGAGGGSKTTPSASRLNSQSFGRRSSFLYQSDADEDHDDDAAGMGDTGISRTSSMSSHVGDETYITPFAQILATLHRVRSQYLTLMDLPEDTKTIHTRPGWTPVPSPNISHHHKKLTSMLERKLAVEVLEEMDWCLKKLETVNSAKSMGNMAHEKFRRMLNRELSHLSEGSRRGAQVADWVTDLTNLGEDKVDRTLGNMYSQRPSQVSDSFESSLSASLTHDTWIRTKESRERKISAQNYSKTVPVFGVDSDKMDKEEMQKYVEKLTKQWNVDVFHFDTVSGSNPLVSSSYIIFKERKLFTRFKIEPHIFVNYMTAIQNLYRKSNPYHNAIHATDVLLGTNYLLNAKSLDGVFSNLEILAALVAAAVHDVDHPGFTNLFLSNVHHDLAILYNDSSILENHHLATAFKTLQNQDCNFLQHFDANSYDTFRKVVIDMVLATDMSKHIQSVAEMKTLLETRQVANNGLVVLDKYNDRIVVLQCLIHCADLSNQAKAVYIAKQWSHRVIEENFLQGDREREMGMAIHPMGDRNEVCISKSQVSFIDYIVYPLWETWAGLVYPEYQWILEDLRATKDYWISLNEPNSPPPEDLSKDNRNIRRSSETEEVKSLVLESPANERRSSFKGIKNTAIGKEISSSLGSIDEPLNESH